MKNIIVIFTLLAIAFPPNLSIKDIQGGSEEKVSFRKIDEGEAFSFRVVNDITIAPLTSIRVWNAPVGSTFSNGIFFWTPRDNQSGMYNVSFSIFDTTTSQTVFSTIRIVVDNTNFDLRVNKLFEYLFTATDPDNDQVEITVTGLPSGATFTGGQFSPKVFSWRPTKRQKGNHQMIITATDFPSNGSPRQDVSIIKMRVR